MFQYFGLIKAEYANMIMVHQQVLYDRNIINI